MNRKQEEFTVQVDKDILLELIDFNRSWNVKWSETAKTNYVSCTEYLGTFDGKAKYKVHYLHRWIMNPEDNEYIDHVRQGETLDNRRSNLRITTNSKNNRHRKGKNSNNTTGYRNVSYDKVSDKYKVQLQVDGKNTVIGKFDSVEEAGKVADLKRMKMYGKFAGSG